jgi:hypothetical protein
MRKAYQTDLTDAEWGCLEPHPVYFTSIRSDLLVPLAVRYISVLLDLRRCFEPARALEVRLDLIARALETLARLELFRGRLEESATYAEEGAELSRELAERPSPRTLLPSMPTAMGLMASWKVGNRAM